MIHARKLERSKQVKKAMAAPAKKGWPKSNRKQYPVPPPKKGG